MSNALSIKTAQTFIYVVFTAFFALSLILAVMPTPARAAGLTEPQIKSVVNLLVAFDVDQATANKVDAILHDQPVTATKAQTVSTKIAVADTNSTPAPTPAPAEVKSFPNCTLSADQVSVAPGTPVTLTWTSVNATYSSSPNGNTEPNGFVTVTPAYDTIYQKTVFGPKGSATCHVEVSVVEPQLPTDTNGSTQNAIPNTLMVMSQPEINLASAATAAAQFPFSLAIDSLTNIFVQLGIGQ